METLSAQLKRIREVLCGLLPIEEDQNEKTYVIFNAPVIRSNDLKGTVPSETSAAEAYLFAVVTGSDADDVGLPVMSLGVCIAVAACFFNSARLGESREETLDYLKMAYDSHFWEVEEKLTLQDYIDKKGKIQGVINNRLVRLHEDLGTLYGEDKPHYCYWSEFVAHMDVGLYSPIRQVAFPKPTNPKLVSV